MKTDRLIDALVSIVPQTLARELVTEFVQIRQDHSTDTLGRASPGKFVESFVQCLQQMSRGTYDASPKVDHFLDKEVEKEANLPDGLRVCGARIARSMYTLRNKRNIAHKGQVDPNSFDLAYLHHAGSWIMAEMLRTATGISMQEAGSLIELVGAPVGTLVEEIDGVRLVHGNVSIKSELLILLHSHFPDRVPLADIEKSLSRRNNGTMRNTLRDLVQAKLADGDTKGGYRLTKAGVWAALEDIRRVAAA
jgi:hypothetical protein